MTMVINSQVSIYKARAETADHGKTKSTNLQVQRKKRNSQEVSTHHAKQP